MEIENDEEKAGIILRSHLRDYQDLEIARILSCEEFEDYFCNSLKIWGILIVLDIERSLYPNRQKEEYMCVSACILSVYVKSV